MGARSCGAQGRVVVWLAPLAVLAGCQVLFGVDLPEETVTGASGGGRGGMSGAGQAGAAMCNLCGAFFDGAPKSAACVDNGPPTSFALTSALLNCLCRSDTCGQAACKATCETDAVPSQACRACGAAACEAEADACSLDDGKGGAGGGLDAAGTAGVAGAAGGGGQGGACSLEEDCEVCCAERESISLADIGRDYFRACFCDSLNNSGSGELCDNATADCVGCCEELCDGGGTFPSPEQLDVCSLCAFRQSGNQGQCANVIEYSCFSRGLANCSLRTCVSNECGP